MTAPLLKAAFAPTGDPAKATAWLQRWIAEAKAAREQREQRQSAERRNAA